MRASDLRIGDVVADTNRTNGKFKLAVVTCIEKRNFVSIRLWSAQGRVWTTRRAEVPASTLRPLTAEESESRATREALESLNGDGPSELLGSRQARIYRTKGNPEVSLVERIARFVHDDGTDAQRVAIADAIRTNFSDKT